MTRRMSMLSGILRTLILIVRAVRVAVEMIRARASEPGEQSGRGGDPFPGRFSR